MDKEVLLERIWTYILNINFGIGYSVIRNYPAFLGLNAGWDNFLNIPSLLNINLCMGYVVVNTYHIPYLLTQFWRGYLSSNHHQRGRFLAINHIILTSAT